MDLSDFIVREGDAKAAKLFKVTERCAQAWRYKYRFPRPEKAREIERVTTGQVTIAECYIPKSATPQRAAA